MLRGTFRLRAMGVVVAGLGAAFCAADARGALTVYEPFNYPAGSVVGDNSGTGFGGAYTGTGNVTSPGLAYQNLNTAGNTFTTASTPTAGNLGVFRTLATPIDTNTGGTIYISFLASLPQATVPSYGGVSLFSGGTATEELFLGKPSNTPNYGYDAKFGAAGIATNGPAASTTPALLVYRLTFSAAGETISAYYNPTPGAAEPAVAGSTSVIPEGTFAATLTSIRLQSGDQPINFDEVRIGTTFADVTPVPEPASAGLLAGVGALMLGRRRRNRVD
jgi:hypothetical protein